MALDLRRASASILSLGDQCLASACNFLTTVLLARALGLESFGIYALAWIAIYLAVGVQLGLTVSPMMSIGPKTEGRAADDYYAAVMAHQALYVAVASACIFGVLSALAASRPDLDGVALPAAAAGATYLAQDFLRRYLFARRRPGAVLAIDLVNQGAKLGALGALWWMERIGVTSALWAVAATAGLSGLCAAAIAGPLSWNGATFRDTTVRQWRSARWLVLTGSVQWVLAYSGLLVTAALLGPRVLGALRAAQSIVAVLNVVREVLENVVPPLAGKALAEAGLPGLRRLAIVAMTCAGAIGIGAVATLSLLGPWLLARLYGPEIAEFEWIFVWYALSFPIALVNVVQGCAFRALERTRPIFLASLAAASFTVVAVYPAARLAGVAGVIAVTLVSDLIVLAWLGRGLRDLAFRDPAPSRPAHSSFG